MIYLCDFKDSFTLNILSVLPEHSHLFKIIEFEQIEFTLNLLTGQSKKSILILGPGPGSPDDYSNLFPSIKKVLDSSHVFTLGICLGHQLIARIFGLDVLASSYPVHGQVQEYRLSKKTQNDLSLPANIRVQRYNSLCVRKSVQNESLIKNLNLNFEDSDEDYFLFYNKRMISYQFHPESIGTNYPESFFKRALSFLI